MFERYNERARRAIFFARWWALNRPVHDIDTRDLILGIVHESNRKGSPYEALHSGREAFVALFAEGVTPVTKPTPRDIPLTRSSKLALAYAAQEADCDRRFTIDPFHLFRGVLRTGDNTAQQLIACGYTLESVREASRIAFAKIPDGPGKRSWRSDLLPRGARRDWIIISFCTLGLLAMMLYLRSQN